jgi:hypothetical protein
MTKASGILTPEQLELRLQNIATTPAERRRIEGINAVLAPLTHGARLQFWLNRRGSLGGITPLEALARGQFEKVRDIAEAFAES